MGPEAVILEGTLPVSIFKYSSHLKIYIYICMYLFIWLSWVLVAALGTNLRFSMQDLLFFQL